MTVTRIPRSLLHNLTYTAPTRQRGRDLRRMSPHPGTRRPPGPEPRYRRGSSSVGLLAAPVTGLPKGSVANVTQLVALDKVSPTEKVGVLPPAKLDLLLFGVDVVLGR